MSDEQPNSYKTLGIAFISMGVSLGIVFGLTLGWLFAPIGLTFAALGLVFIGQSSGSDHE